MPASPDPLAEPAGADAAGCTSEGAAAPDAAPAADTGHPDHAEDHVHSPEREAPRLAPVEDQQTLVEAGELLRALAAPVRIAIVLQLRTAERCVHELVDVLGVTQPLISQHLRVLKSAGVVYGQRHGREVVYRLVDEHLAHIVADAATHAEELSGARPRGRRTPPPPETRQDTETA
ncbi:metalloregulator ArsR/SmtB family transcription factor [Saccharopolyspora sp. SCSIO 74807]|uniref:ArsR/SmtB family transcription factor n=1 Tax=Saccharopolyspora sp. SCSIO 74807 TaxID=3118084 RepID=UPI0030CDBAC6